MDNPIAYVSEFKAVLMDVFSILLGLPSASLAVRQVQKHIARQNTLRIGVRESLDTC